MKSLKIIYNGNVMFDSDIEEFIWTDTPNGVKVEGRIKKSGGGGGAGGLLEMLTSASRAKTAKVAEQHREELLADVEEPQLEEVVSD